MSREENQTKDSMDTYLIYGVCVVLIFLILSMLYESFLIPFSVILSVPAGIMGSFAFAWLWNQGYAALPFVFMGKIDNNIYLPLSVAAKVWALWRQPMLLPKHVCVPS